MTMRFTFECLAVRNGGLPPPQDAPSRNYEGTWLLECYSQSGDKPPFPTCKFGSALIWSAVTCHRFRPRRLDAALLGNVPFSTTCCDRSQRPKRRQVGALQIRALPQIWSG